MAINQHQDVFTIDRRKNEVLTKSNLQYMLGVQHDSDYVTVHRYLRQHIEPDDPSNRLHLIGNLNTTLETLRQLASTSQND